MKNQLPGGYAEKILRVDLTNEHISTEEMTPELARKYIGGSGLGAKILWDEVPPEVSWDHPENRLIMATGPLAGTPVWGNGSLSVVTRGAMTNGATSSQANGFFGVNLKLAGYNAIILQGQARRWVYVYITDSTVELRDASHLLGKDTWETQDLLHGELGVSGHHLSVYGIGPAGENGVRFAMIEGDYGHVASKNGCGCVMGNKRVKCVAIVGGSKGIAVHDPAGMLQVAEEMSYELKSNPRKTPRYEYGTLGGPMTNYAAGAVPIRNYATNIFPEPERHPEWEASALRNRFAHRGHQCGACGMHHCHMNVIQEGPRAGTIVDEPESEGLNGCGPQIGIFNPVDTAWLNTQVDKAGVDVNEFSWVCGWVMECMEKGYITEEQLGFELHWGDVDGANRLLQMIARREGLGDLLAEGSKRAAETIGGPAYECAIFTGKGNTPVGHDHRARWSMLFSCTVGSIGTHEGVGTSHPEEYGLPPNLNPFDPQQLAMSMGVPQGTIHLEDSLGICIFTSNVQLALLSRCLSTVTGWHFTFEDARLFGKRIAALFKAFSARCGHTPSMERPSPRYGSIPVDGPAAGMSIMTQWDQIQRTYYEIVGYDIDTGKPWPKTLREVGLEELVPQVWDEEKAKLGV